ncbi:MAG: NAD-dependent epimerase/dehydratase family protein [Kiritimatiellae bacterium]|nr:NAD-dependent epimerase/dehydratase family protein [Kiritimatiellia bacterium]
MNAQRIMVTGAGGFLGSHVCEYFGARGHAIAAVGRFSLDTESLGRYPNLWRHAGVTLPDPRFVDAVRDFRPDVLVHCAGTASVPESVRDPYGDFSRTVDICAFVLETLRKEKNDCLFVFPSSAAVYGNPEKLPVSEQAPLHPVSPYGYHKRMCELLVEEYNTLHGVPTVTLRIFSAYGERLRKQIVYDLCLKFADTRTRTVELFGTGEETRDFIHAHDVAGAVAAVLAAGEHGVVFNVASGTQTTIRALAGMVARQFRACKPVHFNGAVREGDPRRWAADIRRLSGTGFVAGTDLPSGLSQTCAWFRETHGASGV